MPLVRFAGLRLDQRIVLSVRTALVLGCAALTLVQRQAAADVVAVVLLLAVAVAASLPVPARWAAVAPFQPVAEAVLACGSCCSLEPLPETLLPYLLAPALAAGLAGGVRTAVTAAGLGALVLMLGRLIGAETLTWTSYLAVLSRWSLITLAVGLLGAWVGRLQQVGARGAGERRVRRGVPPDLPAPAGLPAALRRARPGDPGPADAGERPHGRRRTTGARSTCAPPAAGCPRWRSSAPTGSTGTVEGPLFDEAWAASSPMRSSHAFTPGTTGYSAVLPLRIGLRTFGLVALESSHQPFDPTQLAAAAGILEELALRLETALLFSEVRSLATAEERRRLAREIHDGIAQELASMGYVVDDLAARARYLPELETDLKKLRGELTRVISELRLSIFDLRSEVQSTVGLGTALSDYVRQVGASSKLTVHLVLDESPVRLPIDAETELLRIAQEAVTNARKHANAANLWVTCRIDPPSAYLRVEDDGGGLGQPRSDSFGLEVMRERATRIGARLVVGNRTKGGTSVEVTLGPERTAD